tara:strand:+ start:17 stop:481 length:465 start_codon:yes stop_codon:yes gene_type:complete
MIIVCPCDQKRFNIDEKLIPENGRLLKCGACNHTWFYKPSEHTKKNEILLNDNVSVEIEKEEVITNIIKKSESTENNPDQLNEDKKYLPAIKKVKNKNFSKLLLVILISVIALVLLIDTFKGPISNIIPNIDFYLNNLYQSLIDIKLFTINLIN